LNDGDDVSHGLGAARGAGQTHQGPLADPLHWVMVAREVVAGNGSQPVEAVARTDALVDGHPVDVALTPTNVLVTCTLQRRVPPPPLVASFTGFPR
jgi:hypothetical protein